MTQIKKIYDKLQDLHEELDDLIFDLELKQTVIQDKADEHERDLTDYEQARIDDIEELIHAITDSMDYIEDAQKSLEDYY